MPTVSWEDEIGNITTQNDNRTPLANPVPPPLPPRLNEDTTSIGLYGNNYGGYSASPYMSRYGGMGGYGGFGGYGGIGGGYGGLGGMYGGYGGYGGMGGMYGVYGADPAGGIGAMAEESTRSAFQSVEHLVHAFSSVAMMLESTYFALFNSFRAVIGVADHLSHVRGQLAQIMSQLSIVRTLRWIIRKTLYVLGFRMEDPSNTAPVRQMLPRAQQASSWPILAFFSVVLGAPYLIYRMFPGQSETDKDTSWAKGKSPHYVAIAQHDFIGQSEKEISFKSGAKVLLAPKKLQSRVQGWLIGSVDGERIGLIPYNYLKILGSSEQLPSTTTTTKEQTIKQQEAIFESSKSKPAGEST